MPGVSSFPVVDKSKLLISLQRTGCFGSCPAYTVTIDGEGNVIFMSRPPLDDGEAALNRESSLTSGVRVAGTYRTKIDRRQVDALVEQFREANFFDLKDRYEAEITDNPTFIVSLDTGNGKKTVIDYVGREAGMPATVTELEQTIDRAAGTERWIDGTAAVIPLLKAAGVSFDGMIGLELMDAAASRGDVATMERLLDLDAPLSAEQGPNPLRSAIHDGQEEVTTWLIRKGAAKTPAIYRLALTQAVSSDNHMAFDVLFAEWDQRNMGPELASGLLVGAAHNADLRMTRSLLSKGADPNGTDDPDLQSDLPLFEAANGLLSKDEQHSVADRRSVVQTLLAAGASATKCERSYYCKSVLWSVDDPIIARMLIEAGADPDYRDDDGEHILFNISDERVALLLIKSGADLTAVRPADGKTMRGWAEYEKWPKVIALLDQAGL